jgi:LuxR family maltose regulon positive regulatory protein
LESGLNSPLILVSAPPGFGKSTLLSEWARQSGPSFIAWLSLDEGDNDPVRFWDYFIASLQTHQKGAGESVLTMLHSPRPQPIEVMMTTLINEVAAIQNDVTITLDDYHVISSAEIHQAVTFLIDHLPPRMHLIIATRADPPLPLARLRGRRAMVEIRADDLRFTREEATVFLNSIMGLALKEEEVSSLDTRTEGWITGLHMAALSMQGRKDTADFIKDFTGSHRFILDYLIEEVLKLQPVDVQDFLIKTSVLDRLSASLCDSVTGRDDSGDILLDLERTNLFIIPLDESRKWYRYEHLFTDLLRHRLGNIHEMNQAELHGKASRWYESNEFIADAIHHALEAQDWERSATLIEKIAEDLLKRGEVMTLMGWFRALPDEALRSHPQVYTGCCWSLILTGQFNLAETVLEYAEKAITDNEDFLGEFLIMRAYIARARGDYQSAIELSKKAQSLLPKDNIEPGSILSLNLGMAHWHCGHLEESEQALNDAYQKSQRSGNAYVRLTAISILSIIRAARGNLRQAADFCRQAIQMAGDSPAVALNHFVLSALLYEWNELATAEEHIQKGIELSQLSGNMEVQCGGYRTLARTRIALGDVSGADEALLKADEFSREGKVPILDGVRNAACHVQIALAQGDLATASQWAERVTEDTDTSSFYPRLNLTRARILLAKDNKEATAVELKKQYQLAADAGWQYGVMEILTLQALAAPAAADAIAFLAEALKLAQPEGYIRTFVDKGEPIAELLQQVAEQGIAMEYITKILTAFKAGKTTRVKADVSTSGPHVIAESMAEPMSERELEVLRLVTIGLSNREISQRLVISIGTVKTHIHNILGKLDARDRNHAIIRAREIGLV